jgi:predicted ATPase
VLIGREDEIDAIARLLDGAGQRGGALVLRGDAGIGKSTLLAEASRRASERGMRVLSTAGVQAETHLPFAGLHQLLRPVLDHVDALPAPQRDAVLAAFGMTGAKAPDLFLIALAALELLGDAADRAPVLLAVEDPHWLDQATADVLAFVARRLESAQIVLIAALREGFESPLADAGLREPRLGGLDAAAAAALLARRRLAS